jgi:hypothetical protein
VTNVGVDNGCSRFFHRQTKKTEGDITANPAAIFFVTDLQYVHLL